MEHLLKLFPKGNRVCAWKMTEKHIAKYYQDPDIMIFEFNYKTRNWWK